MAILLTGFNAFGQVRENPSQRVVETILAHPAAGPRAALGGAVTGEVLPTEFAAAAHAMGRLLREVRPQAVLCLGVAAGREAINLERVALNLDDSVEPDNAADAPRGRPIVPGGPAAYWSTLPLEAMQAALLHRGFPAVFSNHAGTFVCNHLFYVARHEIERLGGAIPCGLVHLPLPAETRSDPPGAAPGPTLATLVSAVRCCLEILSGG